LDDNPEGSFDTPAKHREATLRLPVRYLKYALAALGLLWLAPRLSTAQSTTSLLTNATVLPRRTFGVRMLAGFHRFDALIGDGPTRNIAASLVTDSLGPTDDSQLALSEQYIQGVFRTLGTTVPSFRLNAGTVSSYANSRIATFPLFAEFGLSSRLTVGVVIPLVETRTTLTAQLNRVDSLSRANVGPNPSLIAANWASNAAFLKSVTDASAALQTRLTQCLATPSTAGCSTILAQQSTVQTLIQNSAAFAGFAQQLYGTGTSNTGQLFVPLAKGTAQKAIDASVDAMRNQFQTFGIPAPTGAICGASAKGSLSQFENLIKAAVFDSLASTDRSSIGDISVGATFQLANNFTGGDSVVRGLHYRLAVNATARFGTGEPYQRNTLFDNSTGYGQNGVIVGGAADLQFTPRVYATALGSFTKQLGSIDVLRIPNTENNALPLTTRTPGTYSAGDVVSVTLLPRYRLAGYLSFDGIYSLTRIGSDTYTALAFTDSAGTAPIRPTTPYGFVSTTTQQLGFGVSYSTLVGNDRGPGRIPFEASFRHVETFSASGGPAYKVFIDQLQLRVFFR
jgi:hypothetical protein